MDILFFILSVPAAISTWFFLSKFYKRKNHSATLSNFTGFVAGIAVWVIIMIFGVILPGGEKPTNQIEYTVISDESKRNIKRTIKVLLKERISETDLGQLAHELKSQETQAYERTLISWSIEGDRWYWARTDFNPDLKVDILGPTVEQYDQLINLNPDIDGEKLGSWVEPSFGDSGSLVIGYQKGGKIYFNEYHIGGSNSNKEYKKQELNGIVTYKAGDKNLSDLIINEVGGLEYWAESKNHKTLNPI